MNARKSKSTHETLYSLFVASKLIFKCVMVLASILVIYHINLANYFPIHTVRVYGVRHTDRQALRKRLLPFVQQGFFALSVDSVRDHLLQMPWVADASVRRIWQDQLYIIISEKKAVAKWNELGLLTASGDLFSEEDKAYGKNLPHLLGPSGKQQLVLNNYQQISRLFAGLHLKIIRLELSQYLTWQILLDNGIILRVGHKDILTRLDHFVKVYPKIVGNRASQVAYIDLRYPNGVAVGWKNV